MNSKKLIKIADRNFSHAKYSSDYQESKYIDWTRDLNIEGDVVFMTDNSLPMVDNIISKVKVGWLMEPRAIFPRNYEWMKSNFDKFDIVLTYDKELINLSDKAHFSPHCGCWINPIDQMIYDKTKLVSIIASNKRQTVGHRFRHSAIKICKDNNFPLDIFGRGYTPVDYKLTALKDYAFSITFENSKSDYYFTEKLMDCFTTGTVPIYWGCPSIGEFFNINGMIIVDNEEDFINEMKNLTLERYESMKPAILENLEIGKKFLLAEDWIYENTNILK